MRILVVSLLRLGDVLLAAPAISLIRKKFPNAQIDLLVNRQSLQAAKLVEGISRIYPFERELYQQALADPARQVLEPFFVVDKLCSELVRNQYEMVFNFTHNKLSGWLCGIFQSSEIVGLALDASGRPRFGSNWVQYLNQKADQLGHEMFHFSDIFRFAVDPQVDCFDFDGWKISPQAHAVAESLASGKSNLVLLQPFTSESKKEWEEDRWVAAISRLSTLQPNLEFLILAAPNEQSRAEKIAAELKQNKVLAQVAGVRLEVVAALMERSQLLITADTSIKHLAILSNIRVIELSLGSSDWHRTGIFSDRQLILQGKVACAPCPHSTDCTQVEHICAQALRPDVVAQIAIAHLNGNDADLKVLAQAHKHHMLILKTALTANGYWQAAPIGEELSETNLKGWIDRLATKLYLNGEHLHKIGFVGTESYRLATWLKNRFHSDSQLSVRQSLNAIRMLNESNESDSKDALRRMRSLVDQERNHSVVQFQQMRAVQSHLQSIENRLQIRDRITKALLNHIGDKYE